MIDILQHEFVYLAVVSDLLVLGAGDGYRVPRFGFCEGPDPWSVCGNEQQPDGNIRDHSRLYSRYYLTAVYVRDDPDRSFFFPAGNEG